MKRSTLCVIIGEITVEDGLEGPNIFGYALVMYLDNKATDKGEVKPEIIIEFISRAKLRELAEEGKHNFVELKFISSTQIILDNCPDYQTWLTE